jgi:hypothetical protein
MTMGSAEDLAFGLLLGAGCGAMSVFFFWQHVHVEGPQQERAKYKTGSLSLAYGWLFAVFAIASPIFALITAP